MTARRGLPTLALLLIYGALSWGVLGLFLSTPGINVYEPASFPRMLHGTAHRPYVGRVLVPILVRGISEATPPSWREAASKNSAELLGSENLKRWKWPLKYLWPLCVASALFLAAFVTWAFALRWGVGIFYELPPLARDVAPAVALCGLPIFFINQNHIYDPATLLLSLLCVLLIAVRSRWYLAAFALACLNKETALLLIPIFVARHKLAPEPHLEEKGFRILLAAQVSIYVAARVGIGLAFRGNGGGATEFHLAHNWAIFGDSTRLLPFACFVLGCAAVCAHGWRKKPVLLRAALLLTAIPLLGLALFPGIIVLDELRAYYEAYSFVVLLAVPSVCSLRLGEAAWHQKPLP